MAKPCRIQHSVAVQPIINYAQNKTVISNHGLRENEDYWAMKSHFPQLSCFLPHGIASTAGSDRAQASWRSSCLQPQLQQSEWTAYVILMESQTFVVRALPFLLVDPVAHKVLYEEDLLWGYDGDLASGWDWCFYDICPSSMWEHSNRTPSVNQKLASSDTQSNSALILHFPTPKQWEKCLIFPFKTDENVNKLWRSYCFSLI